jgi:hypothetical protein
MKIESARTLEGGKIHRYALLGVLRSCPKTPDALAVGGVDGR